MACRGSSGRRIVGQLLARGTIVATLQDGDFLAPDGIIIRPIRGVSSALTSVVMGIIPPRDGDYPVHLHHALEQVTFVLSGTVTALQRGPSDPHAVEIELRP